jgi:hypothetical protein
MLDGVGKEIEDAVTAAGHSCSKWRFGSSEDTVKHFVESALAVPEPVCVCYTGHGLAGGWAYGRKQLYSYRVLAKAVAKRKGIPTAIISDCCHAGVIVDSFQGSGFDRSNTIALTASSSARMGLITSPLAKNHTGRVFKAWFEERKPFNPFDYSDNSRFDIDEVRRWEHWARLGPERFGPRSIDQHFFSKTS